ncbi:MAG: BlaI/MecI/CopY family transcriptional regulator [Candidatus Levybacteria bacterium]|nr:BlaI/MecI/CopY family transcriptional regulator [Candidatus Levybacteria bacterium]
MRKDYGKVLGELETQVMEIIWQAKEPISVSEVVAVLSKKRDIAYTTVMTIMTRLIEKGLLKRTALGKAYVYKPIFSKDTFLTKVSQQIIKNLVSRFGDKAIAHFAQELDKVPEEKKAKLLQILKQAKNS